jgi:hypothetical protein
VNKRLFQITGNRADKRLIKNVTKSKEKDEIGGACSTNIGEDEYI